MEKHERPNKDTNTRIDNLLCTRGKEKNVIQNLWKCPESRVKTEIVSSSTRDSELENKMTRLAGIHSTAIVKSPHFFKNLKRLSAITTK